MNITYKIYYNDHGDITMLTTTDKPGNYVVVEEEYWNTVNMNPLKYAVKKGEVVLKKKLIQEPPTLKVTNQFDHNQKTMFITKKNNLFECVDSVTIEVDWFDNNKHQWVKYDS
jgi:hypothetical protein